MKLNGHAIRVPLLTGSLTDAVFEMQRKVTAEEVNKQEIEELQSLLDDLRKQARS